MSGIHIYRATDQPATRFKVDVGTYEKPRTMVVKFHPNKQLWAMCCRRRRIAGNMIVHVYYDGHSFFCAHDKGCRGDAEREKKRRREFKNRSAASKVAWARRRAALAASAPDQSGR